MYAYAAENLQSVWFTGAKRIKMTQPPTPFPVGKGAIFSGGLSGRPPAPLRVCCIKQVGCGVSLPLGEVARSAREG